MASEPAVETARVSAAGCQIPVLVSPFKTNEGADALPVESIETKDVPALKTVPTPPD